MITPTQGNQPFPFYDPMATQFMTGGRLPYMPDTQFLTSSEYGAYRSVPTPRGLPQMHHYPSLWESYLTANRGRLPGLPFPNYMVDVYNPAVDMQRHMAMARRRLNDSMLAMGGGAADFGSQWLVGGGLGLALGGPLGMLAGVGMSSYVSPAAPILDRIRRAREIQDVTMSKIVAGPQVYGPLGQGFSTQASRSIDAGIRQMSAGDMSFKEADYRSILRLGVESGMFDYSINSEQYKRVMKTLRGNFKVMMELLEVADLGELSKNMQRLMQMGANVGQMAGIASSERMFSRMLGVNYDTMVNTYGQQGALMYTQAGLTPYQGSLTNVANAARVTVAQRLGLLNPAEIARAGGVSGLSQNLTQQGIQITQNTQDMYLPFFATQDFSGIDRNTVQRFMSGGMSLEDLMVGSGARVGNARNMARYMASKPELLRKLVDTFGSEGKDVLDYQIASNLGRRLGLSGQDALMTGYMMLSPDNPGLAKQRAMMMSNPDVIKSMMQNIRLQERKLTQNALEEWRHTQGIRGVAAGVRKGAVGFMEDTWGSFANEWSAVTDYEESKASGSLGVLDFGLGVGGNLTEAELTGLRGPGGIGTDSWNETLYQGMARELTGFDRLRFGGSEGNVAHYRFLDKFLKARGISPEQYKKGLTFLQGAGLSELELSRLANSGFTRRGRFTQDRLRELLVNKVGAGAADNILSSPEAMQTIFKSIATANPDAATYVEDFFRERSFETEGNLRKGYGKTYARLEDELGEFTRQGIFGLNNAADTDILKAGLSKDRRAVGLSFMGTLFGQWADPDATRLGTAGANFLKAQMLRIAREGKLLGEDDTAKLEGLLRDDKIGEAREFLISRMVSKKGLSREDAEAVFQVGVRKSQGDRLSAKAIEDQASKTLSFTKEYTQLSASRLHGDLMRTMASGFQEAGMRGYSLSELLTNADLVRDLLKNGGISNQPKMRKILKELSGLQSKGTVTLEQLVANVSPFLDGNMTVEKDTNRTPGDMSTERKETLDALRTSFKSLEDVLVEVQKSLNGNTAVLQEVNRTQNKDSSVLGWIADALSPGR